MRLEFHTARLPLRTPLRAAWGELREREVLRVRLTFGEDDWGEGEAAPLEPYDGVADAVVRTALAAYAEILAPVGDDVGGAGRRPGRQGAEDRPPAGVQRP